MNRINVKWLLALVLLLGLLGKSKGFAQSDSLRLEASSVVIDTTQKHSPKLATILSTVLPGAGQFYNRKYWKIPIIYALGGALVYSWTHNNNNYHKFRQAYVHAYNTGSSPQGFQLYSKDQLKLIKDDYRRNRDLSVVGVTLLYVLNIVDATVDGYLFDYDISDDLSLRVEPNMMFNNYTSNNCIGLRCSVRF